MEKGRNTALNKMSGIPWREKFAFCLGDPGLTLVYALTTGLLIYFYTNVVGISAGIVGTIMLVSRLFDGVTDLIMGFIIDNTKSKYGKCRPWILRLTIPYGIAAVLLMTVPHSSVTVQAIYIFVTYNLMNSVLYTGIGLPYSTLGSLITRDQDERTVITNVRMAFSTIASLIITALTLPLINRLGGDQRAWIMVTAIYAVVAMLLLFNCFYQTRERVQVAQQEQEKLPIMTGLKALVQNKYFFFSLAMLIVFTAYQILLSTDLAYYCQYVLGDNELMSPLSMAEKIPQLLCILCLLFMVKKFRKREMVLVGSAIGLIGSLVTLSHPESMTVLIIGAALRGIGIGPYYGVCFALMADTVEYGDWKTGIRIEGLLFSATTVAQKFGSGITSAVIGWAFSAAGFDGTAAVQTASAVATIKGAFLYAPIVIWVLFLVLMAIYKLDKMYPQIIKELNEREAKRAQMNEQ